MDLTNNALTELTVQLSLDRARFCKSGSFDIFLQPFSKQRTALKKGRKLFNLFKTNIRCVFYIHIQAISKEKLFPFQWSIKTDKDAHFKNNISPLFLFYTLVVICSPKISFPVFANSSQIFLSVLNDLVKREENTRFVFRNDFETSFWLKQSTNQRLASAHQEVSRHKKHCQDLNGTYQYQATIYISKSKL